jgi:hypothetical protein
MTFSPVIKSGTIRTVLTLAVSRGWPMHQLDVKNHYFTSYLVSLGFVKAKSDTSLFVYSRDTGTAYLSLYVDDIVLTASSPELLQHTTTALQQQFVTKDLGPLHHFLGVSVEQWSNNLFLHQRQYARDILGRAGMSDCKPCPTPVDTQAKVSSDMGSPVSDSTAYCSLVRALHYLTFTMPDIAYAVHQVCLHMHDPL